MNELELLDQFRADVPAPDASQVERARTALWREIRAGGGIPAAPTRPRVARPVLLAAAAATVASVGLSLLPHGSPLGGAEPAAAAVLVQAASTAQQQPAENRPMEGQYVYVRLRESATYLYGPPDEDLTPFFYTEVGTTQRWTGVDGSGRSTYTGMGIDFPTSQDRAAWVAAGSPRLQTRDGSESYRPGELSFLDLSGLPSDPEALLEIIEQREIVGGPSGDWESFAIIGDLLRAHYAPPDVRSGLYELASQLSGVEYIGSVSDLAGRTGTAVGYTHNGLRHMLIFDPKTTELLGERSIVVDADEAHLEPAPDTILGLTGPEGTIVYEVAYLDRAVTPDTGEDG